MKRSQMKHKHTKIDTSQLQPRILNMILGSRQVYYGKAGLATPTLSLDQSFFMISKDLPRASAGIADSQFRRMADACQLAN